MWKWYKKKRPSSQKLYLKGTEKQQLRFAMVLHASTCWKEGTDECCPSKSQLTSYLRQPLHTADWQGHEHSRARITLCTVITPQGEQTSLFAFLKQHPWMPYSACQRRAQNLRAFFSWTVHKSWWIGRGLRKDCIKPYSTFPSLVCLNNWLWAQTLINRSLNKFQNKLYFIFRWLEHQGVPGLQLL